MKNNFSTTPLFEYHPIVGAVNHVGFTAMYPSDTWPHDLLYFYVLRLCSTKPQGYKCYSGFTTQQPVKRLKGHNKGNTNSTKKRRPFKLIYYEAHLSGSDARRREKYFKTSKGKSTLRQILGGYLRKDIFWLIKHFVARRRIPSRGVKSSN